MGHLSCEVHDFTTPYFQVTYFQVTFFASYAVTFAVSNIYLVIKAF